MLLYSFNLIMFETSIRFDSKLFYKSMVFFNYKSFAWRIPNLEEDIKRNLIKNQNIKKMF